MNEMSSFDAENGVVTLGDWTISGGMTPADFANAHNFRRTGSLGTREWYIMPRVGEWDWILSFHEARLRTLVLWDSANRDALRKARHDTLLMAAFGEPDATETIGPTWGPFKPPTQSDPWLADARNLVWHRPWGKVWSGIEGRDWTPQISVRWT